MSGMSGTQGDLFEETLAALLEKLIRDDLGWRQVTVEKLGRGTQFGADLRLGWVGEDDVSALWHIECKSDRDKALPEKEIDVKLVQAARSSDEPDVWCLALSDVELAPNATQSLVDTPKRLGVPFTVTALSPQKGIQRLYSCHPLVYKRQYGQPAPGLTHRERERVIAEFGEWLMKETVALPASAIPSGWKLVRPSQIDLLPDDPGHARRYLSAGTMTCPWEAIAYGWAVARPSAEDSLWQLLEKARPGFCYEWLIGAGGEGKSTILRQIAWQAGLGEWQVLWADGGTACVFPAPWIELRLPGSKVLVCVDETLQLSGMRNAFELSEKLAAIDVTVVALLADQGAQWRRKKGRLALGRSERVPRRLGPLSSVEQKRLAEALEQRGLLWDKSVDEALARLSAAASGAEKDVARRRSERSWLVPTIMRLTDPADRPFEQILGGVLRDLYDASELHALKVLLAVAVIHAAGDSLPARIARRIVAQEDELETALDILTTELEPEDIYAPRLDSRSGGERFLTHGYTISDGFVGAALIDPMLERQLEAVCAGLAEATRKDYDAEELLPDELFNLLDHAVDYLDGPRRAYREAAVLLERWADIAPQDWLTRHRLGQAFMHAVSDLIRSNSADEELVQNLASRSESEFRAALDVARRVLNDPGRPRKYLDYKLDRERQYIYHGWSVLELTLGEPRRNRPVNRLLRACFLALMGIDVANNRQTQQVCGVWLQALFYLQRIHGAWWAAAVLGRDNYIVKRFARRFEQKGMVDLAAPDVALDEIVAEVANLVAPKHEQIRIVDDEREHKEMVVAVLRKAVPSLRRGGVTVQTLEKLERDA